MSASGKESLTRRTALRALGAAGLVGLAGCTGGDGGDGGGGDGSDGGGGDGGDGTTGGSTTSGPELEDELTVYAPTGIGPVARAFEERFGVTVNDTVHPGPQVLAKFKTEAESGNVKASVVTSAGGNLLWPSNKKHLAKIDIEGNDAVWDEARRSTFEEMDGIGYAWPWATLIRGTPYNTNNVDSPPVKWADCTESNWEGSFITPPYNMERVYAALLLGGWSEDRAKQYLKDMKPNIGSFQPGVPANIEKIVGGQADIGLQLMGFFVAGPMNDGAPVDITFPEFTTEHIETVVVPKEAPSPEAARVFTNWLVSDEGQEIVQGDLGFNPAHTDMGHGSEVIAERIDEYDPDIHPLMFTSPEQAEEYDAIVKETIGI